MKDNRFTELVNLYIDRQISAGETDELEAEIQANPRRRAIYRQYCHIHRATKQVYDSFRTESADDSSAPTSRRNIIARFDVRPAANYARWTYVAGGLAAACLAVVLIRFDLLPKPGASSSEYAVLPPASVSTVRAAPAPAAMLASSPRQEKEPTEGLVSLRNKSAIEPGYVAALETIRRDEQRASANGQMPSTRQISLFDDGVFDSPQVLPANNQRTFRAGGQAPDESAELTAFQFRR